MKLIIDCKWQETNYREISGWKYQEKLEIIWVLQVLQEIWKFVLCLARLQKCKKLLTIHPGEALKGTKGVNMYLDQRYYEPRDAIGRELFSAG